MCVWVGGARIRACMQGGQDKITCAQGSRGKRVRIQKSCHSSPYPPSSEGAFLLKALTQALRAQECDVNVDLLVWTAVCVYVRAKLSLCGV